MEIYMIEKRDTDIILKNPIDWEKFRNKTVLVTGATGRLGMYIIEAMIKADIDYNLSLHVVALARNEKKLQKIFGLELKLPNVHCLIQDITEKIVYKEKIDYIFHTAGPASPSDFTNFPVDTLWIHVLGTRNILEFARQNCSMVFYVSTIETYGECKSEQNLKEEDMGVIRCDNARACYPEAKRLCETMLASYEAQFGIRYMAVRLCHTFGPGISLDDGRAFAEFLSDVINGKDIILQSDGSPVRTYTYVADAVGGMLVAATRGQDHYYNIANPNNLISIRNLAELIAGLDPKKKCRVRYEGDITNNFKYLPFKLGIMDVSKIEQLGWCPQVGLEDAFRYTMLSFMQRE